MATQADVAKKAGVSFITVSRVINKNGYVKKETREKVLKAIKELNYYTNHIGRALRNKCVNTIGVVIPEPPDVTVHGMEYYNMLLQGVDRFTVEHGYDILLSTYKADDDAYDYFRLYFQRKVDGLIFFIPDMRRLRLADIVKNKIPCVIVGERTVHPRISYVDAENFDGMRQVTDYLLSRGAKKICFIKGKSYMQNSIDRLNGFLAAMNQHGHTVPAGSILEGDYTIQAGVAAMEKILKEGDAPDAIICSNDHMAMGVLSAAKQARIRIPNELSLIGFDDISVTGLLDPPLSTVRQPLFDMGYKASEILYQKILTPGRKAEKVVFPVELVVRKSIA